MKNGVIYIYTSPSGKSYVGQTWNEQRRRWDHSVANGRSPAFHAAIKKYGKDAFSYRILHSGIETQEELNRLECKAICDFKTLSPDGYNLTTGGEGGLHIEATKERLRQIWIEDGDNRKEAMKRAAKRPEVRDRLVQNAIKNAANPEIIASLSAKLKQAFASEDVRKSRSLLRQAEWADPQIRKKRTQGLRNAQATEEYKKKLSDAMKKRWSDPDYQKSMSLKLTGKKRPQSATDAARLKRMVKVLCVETGRVFQSASEAANFAGVSRASISGVIGKPGRRSGGYRWEYAENGT